MTTITYFLLYVLIAVVTAVVYLMRRNLNYWKNRGIPCDEPHPIYGNLRGFRSTHTIHQIHYEYYKKYRNSGAPFVGFYFLGKKAAYILDTKLVKNILIRDFSNFADRGQFYNERDDPLTGHLFNLEPVKWKNLRQKLSPTFTSGKMKFMYPTIVKVAEEFLKVMQEVVPPGGSVLEVKDLMGRFTTDVIGTCAFGIECNTLRTPETEFRTMGRKAFTDLRHNKYIIALILAFPTLARTLRMRIVPDDVHHFFMKIVHETVAMREQHKIKRNDFMDMLIELKNKSSITLENGEVIDGVTIDELAAQVFVFFLAGFETSSSTMSYVLYELAQHQEVQERARVEINEVLEQHKQILSYECVKDLRYLDQIISETLRLYTLVPELDRMALSDYVVSDNPKYVIEKGCAVVIPACAIHRDPEYYPEPEKFDPDRFSPEQVAQRDSVEWLPFGDGPRNCIGKRFGEMQARVGLALLLKNFKFEVCDKTQIPLEFDPESFVLGTIGGIYLNVKRV